MRKTFPKMGQIYKLFRDDYHNLMKNIYPWFFVRTILSTVRKDHKYFMFVEKRPRK